MAVISELFTTTVIIIITISIITSIPIIINQIYDAFAPNRGATIRSILSKNPIGKVVIISLRFTFVVTILLCFFSGFLILFLL
jgi:hypothetical protein